MKTNKPSGYCAGCNWAKRRCRSAAARCAAPPASSDPSLSASHRDCARPYGRSSPCASLPFSNTRLAVQVQSFLLLVFLAAAEDRSLRRRLVVWYLLSSSACRRFVASDFFSPAARAPGRRRYNDRSASRRRPALVARMRLAGAGDDGLCSCRDRAWRGRGIGGGIAHRRTGRRYAARTERAWQSSPANPAASWRTVAAA